MRIHTLSFGRSSPASINVNKRPRLDPELFRVLRHYSGSEETDYPLRLFRSDLASFDELVEITSGLWIIPLEKIPDARARFTKTRNGIEEIVSLPLNQLFPMSGCNLGCGFLIDRGLHSELVHNGSWDFEGSGTVEIDPATI